MSVISYHLIWTNYGTWLANDPRGSGSRSVYTPALSDLGEVHYGRKSVQPARKHVREFYEEAESRLQFPVVRLDDSHRNEVGASFEETVCKYKYTCYASAIMPDHVHVVVRKHRDSAETMIEMFQRSSRARLNNQNLVPADHPVWTKNGWKVFLRSPEEVSTRIRYVEGNPAKEGLSRQDWAFVKRYDNWPFHKKGS